MTDLWRWGWRPHAILNIKWRWGWWPHAILNIKWRWRWRQMSLKNKWLHHDDLAVTLNDAAPWHGHTYHSHTTNNFILISLLNLFFMPRQLKNIKTYFSNHMSEYLSCSRVFRWDKTIPCSNVSMNKMYFFQMAATLENVQTDVDHVFQIQAWDSPMLLLLMLLEMNINWSGIPQPRTPKWFINACVEVPQSQ